MLEQRDAKRTQWAISGFDDGRGPETGNVGSLEMLEKAGKGAPPGACGRTVTLPGPWFWPNETRFALVTSKTV